MTEYLLGILPAVLLAISLLLGCYPGEAMIVCLARRSRCRPPRRASPAGTRRRPSTGACAALRLLAASRPLRGPPSISLAQS